MNRYILFVFFIGITFNSYCQVSKDSLKYLGYGYAFVANNDQISIDLIDQNIHDLDVADTLFNVTEALSYNMADDHIKYYCNGNFVYDNNHVIVDTSVGKFIGNSAQCFFTQNGDINNFEVFVSGEESRAPSLNGLNFQYGSLTTTAAYQSNNDVQGEQVGLISSVYDTSISFLVPKIYSDSFLYFKTNGISTQKVYTQIPYQFGHKTGDGMGRTKFTVDGSRFITTTYSGHIFIGDIDMATGILQNVVHDSVEQFNLRPYGVVIFKEKAFVSCIKDTNVILLIYNIYNGARLDSIVIFGNYLRPITLANITVLSDKIVVYTDQYFTYFRGLTPISSIANLCQNNLQIKPNELWKSFAIPESIYNYTYSLEFSSHKTNSNYYKFSPNKAISNYSNVKWVIENPKATVVNLEREPEIELNSGISTVILTAYNKTKQRIDTIVHRIERPFQAIMYSFDTILCIGDKINIDKNFMLIHFNDTIDQNLIIDSKGNYTFYSNSSQNQYQLNVGIDLCKDNIPNVFTPNNDGHNDVFHPIINRFLNYLDPIVSYHIVILNRDKQIVFESDHIESSWDGMFHGQYAVEGVFLYSIEINYPKHSEKILGDLTLIR